MLLVKLTSPLSLSLLLVNIKCYGSSYVSKCIIHWRIKNSVVLVLDAILHIYFSGKKKKKDFFWSNFLLFMLLVFRQLCLVMHCLFLRPSPQHPFYFRICVMEILVNDSGMVSCDIFHNFKCWFFFFFCDLLPIKSTGPSLILSLRLNWDHIFLWSKIHSLLYYLNINQL